MGELAMLRSELTREGLRETTQSENPSSKSPFVEVTEQLLQNITQSIVSRFNPEKVVLFGSHVWGTPHACSDVDLLVIVEDGQDTSDLEVRIYRECRVKFVPMDILVYTPAEITKRLRMGDFFVRRILREGRVLYERRSNWGAAQASPSPKVKWRWA